MTDDGIVAVAETVPDAPWLNCDNAHLAALLQFYGAADPSGPMGQQWGFALRSTAEVPVTLGLPVLTAIERETGLVFDRRQVPMAEYHETVEATTAAGTPMIIYGDAFHMPWLPYFGNDSSAHPTILAGVSAGEKFHIVEAYTNSTPWGRVVPGPATVTRAEFDTLVEALHPAQRGEVISLSARRAADPRPLREILRANADGVLARVRDAGDMAAFAGWARGHAGDATAMALYDLGCWEVTRARSCHASWLRRVAGAVPGALPEGFADRFAAEVDLPWRRVSQFAFVNAQRVARGARPATASMELVEQLAVAEVALAGELARHLDGTDA
jgi:hypothetical protein